MRASGCNTKPAATRSEHFVETLAEFGDYEFAGGNWSGRQGVVYRARQKSLNRTVALKVIGLGDGLREPTSSAFVWKPKRLPG